MRGPLPSERGDALIEGLLALGLVLLAVAVGAQALAYAHARSVAEAAAQDGARAAVTGHSGAAVARARAILAAAGETGAGLSSSARVERDRVTVNVGGRAPSLFPLSLIMPRVEASATLPLERYPQEEARP